MLLKERGATRSMSVFKIIGLLALTVGIMAMIACGAEAYRHPRTRKRVPAHRYRYAGDAGDHSGGAAAHRQH